MVNDLDKENSTPTKPLLLSRKAEAWAHPDCDVKRYQGRTCTVKVRLPCQERLQYIPRIIEQTA